MPVHKIGTSVGYGMKSQITIAVKNACIESTVLPMMKIWEETSYRLELQQTLKQCADAEFCSLSTRIPPTYKLTFDPDEDKTERNKENRDIRVAIIREEGVNGDREMAAAFLRVGFKVWDITMEDLLTGEVNLDLFKGLVFPGGFSYAGNIT